MLPGIVYWIFGVFYGTFTIYSTPAKAVCLILSRYPSYVLVNYFDYVLAPNST